MKKEAILAHTVLLGAVHTPAMPEGLQDGRGRRGREGLNMPREQCCSPFPPQKELAESKHQYSIDELKHRENLIQARLDDELAWQVELEKHKVLCWGRGDCHLPPVSCLPLPWLQDAGHGSWA